MERSELLLDAAKFEGVFDSISTTLVEQTSVLRSMYNLDVKKLAFDKEVKKDAARDKALRVDDAAVQTETQSNDNSNASFNNTGSSITAMGSGLAALVGGALGGISVAGLGAMVVKGGFLALVAPKIGEFISGAVKATLDKKNPPDKPGDGTDEFNKSISDGIGDAFTYGFIGRLFGKRVAAIATIGGFVGSFSDEIIKKFGNKKDVIEKFGMEFDNTAVGNILTAIGSAIALITPMLIRRALPNILAGTIVGAGAGSAAALAIDKDGKEVDRKPRNFTHKGYHKNGDPRLFNSKGKELMPNNSNYKSSKLAFDSDQDLMKRLQNSPYKKFAKVAKRGGILGSIISIPYIAAILLNERATDEQKIAALSEELGALFGGIGGAALGTSIGAALGVVSGPGLFLTALGGGLAGGFAGEWLGGQLAEAIVTDANSIDDVPEDMLSRTGLPSMGAVTSGSSILPPSIEPRPTYSGMQGDYDRNDWDNTVGLFYNRDGTLKPQYSTNSSTPSVEPMRGPDQVIDRQRRLQSLESNATNFGEAKSSMLLAEGAKVFKAGSTTTVSNITNITKIDSSPSLSNDSGIMTAFS